MIRAHLRPLAKLAAFLVALAVMLVSSRAHAGATQFRDTAELFGPMDRQVVANRAAAYPFDVRVLTTSAYDATDQFHSYVRSQLSGPNAVIVGIDPTHRRTAVFCGASTRVEASRCKIAAEAAHPYFREARWAPGIDAVLGAVNAAVGTATGATLPSTSPTSAASRRMSGGWVFGFVLLGAIGLMVIVAVLASVFRRKNPTFDDPRAPYGSGGSDAGQPYVGQPYPYQGGPGMGGGGVGSHLAAAGLGGLAGYALGRALDRRDHDAPYEPGHQADMSPDAPWGSSQPGAEGGSTSWDDPGDPGASMDVDSDFGGGDGGGSDW
ncbi:MAG: TPM domain-containing protein [Deltaproteobacteria bacterium]|nr:TPM domain-containing protein [Deltaproteobacteria bacterium]